MHFPLLKIVGSVFIRVNKGKDSSHLQKFFVALEKSSKLLEYPKNPLYN